MTVSKKPAPAKALSAAKPAATLPTVTYPSMAAASRAAVLALGDKAAFTTKPDNKGQWTWTAGTANKPAEPKAPGTFGAAIVLQAGKAKAAAAPAKSPLAKALAKSVAAKGNAKPAPAKAPAKPVNTKGKRQLPAQALGGKAPAEKPAKGISRDRANWAKPYDTKGAMAGALNGALPPEPDFSAPTHAGYRNRLAAIVAMVKAGDIAGLKADDTEAKSSSRNAIVRYRDLAIAALQAQGHAKAERAAKKAAKVTAPAKPAKGKGKPSQPVAQA